MRTVLTLFLLAGALAGSAHLRPLYAGTDPDPVQTLLGDGQGDGTGVSLPCGQGTKVKCGEVSNYQCTKWIQQPTLSFGVTGATYGITYFCQQWTTVTTYKFFDP